MHCQLLLARDETWAFGGMGADVMRAEGTTYIQFTLSGYQPNCHFGVVDAGYADANVPTFISSLRKLSHSANYSIALPSDVLTRLHVHRTPATRWRHRERDQLPILEYALDRRVEGRRELEIGIPAAGPSAKGNRGACESVVICWLEKHPVERRVHVGKLVGGRLVCIQHVHAGGTYMAFNNNAWAEKDRWGGKVGRFNCSQSCS
jgi:hypothetical protein